LLSWPQRLRAAETTTFVHVDALGSPLAATDEQGDLVWREEYLPYGERIQNEGAATNNSRWYTGHPHDDATGLGYAGARWYDPVAGRFLAIDPRPFDEGNPHTFGRYVYGNNNPYTYVDPDGRSSRAVVGRPIYPYTAVDAENRRRLIIATEQKLEALKAWLLGKPVWKFGPTWGVILNEGGEDGDGDGDGNGGVGDGGERLTEPPPGYWPGDKGAKEWGRRNADVGPTEAGRRFHRGIKGRDNQSHASDDYWTNPDTGDVIDPAGDYSGNLADDYD
jgi:RHS repeat-associated protein